MFLDSNIFLLYLYRKTEKTEKKNWSLCRVHKPKHSAKWPYGACKKEALPSAIALALGKVLNLCRVPNPGTRQRFELCRVPSPWHSGKFKFLPSAQPLALDKVQIFVECQGFSTRQSTVVLSCGMPLCRVYWLKHSAKWPVFCFFAFFLCFSIQIQQIYI